MILLLQLFLAHIIGDFFLQPTHWVKDKELRKWRSPYLYLHVLIHFVLMMLITHTWLTWKLALIITLLHLFTDLAKLQFQTKETRREWFLADQLIHLLVILAAGSWYAHLAFDYSLLTGPKPLIIAGSILLVLKPASLFIKILISKWEPDSIKNGADSLQNAGEWIGMLERLMIILFIYLARWEAIGFLLAAKSVFRFGDLKEAKDKQLTEYVLIGTLLSFGISILTGLVAAWMLISL